MPLWLVQGDITKMETDAIVNAVNCGLKAGGGVCGAIFRAAGERALTKACDAIGGCITGEAVITPGFCLPAKYIIHTPGPVWEGGTHGEEEKLRACYTNSLALAQAHACKSIAFPLISSGIYGYPREEAISVATSAIGAYLLNHTDIDVYLVLYENAPHAGGGKLFPGLASYIDARYVAKNPCAAEEVTVRIPAGGDAATFAEWFQNARADTAQSSQEEERRTSTAECRRPGLHLPNLFAWLQRRKLQKKTVARPKQLAAKPTVSAIKPMTPTAEPEAPAVRPTISCARPCAAPQMPESMSDVVKAVDAIGEQLEYEEARLSASARPAARTERKAYDAEEPIFHIPTLTNRKLEDVVRQLDESFSARVLRIIDEKGWTDVEVYKRANIDRKLFSKIRSDPKYQPSKRTAVALAIALRLNLDETRDLLQKAGYALSRSNLSDVIVEYFIEANEYDIFKINLALYENGQALLSA